MQARTPLLFRYHRHHNKIITQTNFNNNKIFIMNRFSTIVNIGNSNNNNSSSSSSSSRGRGGGSRGGRGASTYRGGRGGGSRGGFVTGSTASASHHRESSLPDITPKHNIPLCDIGANLTNKSFKNDVESVLKRCQQSNVRYVILTGTSESISKDSIQLVRRFRPAFSDLHLHSTVGIHPHDAKSADSTTMKKLEQMIVDGRRDNTVCAVGETGLDFNRMFSPQQNQEDLFREHVKLAIQHKMPMFLHERDAHESFVKILNEFDRSTLPPIVVHCFTGTAEECKQYVKMGFYIGFTACICKEKRGMHLRQMIHDGIIPLDKIMIETDAPYMSPSYAIRRMEPCYLSSVVTTLAKELNKTEEEIARITTENAKRFFNI